MKACIFDDYFHKGKICFREYNCDNCPVREEVKKVVQTIAQSNKSLKPTSSKAAYLIVSCKENKIGHCKRIRKIEDDSR